MSWRNESTQDSELYRLTDETVAQDKGVVFVPMASNLLTSLAVFKKYCRREKKIMARKTTGIVTQGLDPMAVKMIAMHRQKN